MAYNVPDLDPLKANQNARIKFQTSIDAASLRKSGLNPSEVTLALAVLQRNGDILARRPQLLFVGNSQTMAIMDQRAGDLTTPQWLQVLLARRAGGVSQAPSLDVRLGSLPNITPTETLIQLVDAREQKPPYADALVICAVLEEMRNVGVRDEVEKLARRPTVRAELTRLVTQNPDLTKTVRPLSPYIRTQSQVQSSDGGAGGASPSHLAAPDVNAAPVEKHDPDFTAPLERTLQNSVERVPLFAHRTDLFIQAYSSFYVLRNHLAGITSSSPRPVPLEAYETNLQLIEMILRYARARKIPVAIYLAPIRPIKPNPNVDADVARFRRDVPALCRRYNVICLDTIDAIPEKLWTNYPDDAGQGGQRDFAHFTGDAHKMMANRLVAQLGPHFDEWAKGGRAVTVMDARAEKATQ